MIVMKYATASSANACQRLKFGDIDVIGPPDQLQSESDWPFCGSADRDPDAAENGTDEFDRSVSASGGVLRGDAHDT
jgi:hypothetical protein